MKASSVSAYLELARWQNCLIAAAGVLVGAWWAGWAHSEMVALAACAAIALAVAINSFNDVMDEPIDYFWMAHRPIPAGEVSMRGAVLIAAVAALVGITLAAIVDLPLGYLTVGVVAIGAGYSFLKRLGLPGNVAAAVVASLPFLYGAWAAGNPRAGLALFAIAAPLHFAREIAKDIDDQPGDVLGGRRTVPIRWGLKAATALILVALLAFAVQIVPVARAWPRLAFGILPALAFAGYAAGRSVRGLPGAPRAFKAAMLCAMAAFVIARV